MVLWTHGRVAGISGIVGGLVRRTEDLWTFRAPFLAGLLLTGFVAALIPGVNAFGAGGGIALPVAGVAGLLVGFGTQRGSGCTSGHGVCGISRLSVRSIAATMVFMAAGIVTVFVVRHLWHRDVHAPAPAVSGQSASLSRALSSEAR